ncbi:MAG: autotransporter assembly complex protein TamA [Verrucomicrobiota bacterium]
MRVFRPARLPCSSGSLVASILIVLTGFGNVALCQNLRPTVTFSGIDNKKIVEELRRASRLVNAKDMSTSAFLAAYHGRQDVPRLEDILHSYGHFQPKIQVDVREPSDNEIRVDYAVEPGPVYTIESVDVEIVATPPEVQPLRKLTPEMLGLSRGEPARAKDIRAARGRLESSARAAGYPFAETSRPELRVNHETRTAKVTLRCRAGRRATFGELEIRGLEFLAPDVVRNKVPWAPGDRYDPEAVGSLRRKLMESGLFSLVNIEHADELTADGRLPMIVTVSEAEPRLFTVGVGYETDIGPGVQTSWDHRNLLGGGEHLQLGLDLSTETQEANIALRLQHLPGRDQSLRLQFQTKNEDTDAYESISYQASAHAEWRMSPHLKSEAGIGYKYADIDDARTRNTFHLLSLPVALDWDVRDDVLNPTEGGQILAQLTSVKEIFSGDRFYQKYTLSARRFFSVSPSLVFALRSRVGGIWGAALDDVPADDRFFAGGGGSIRGYPYQEVAPRRAGDPFGGRSLLEVTGEVRWQWSETIGWAVFVDGGNAFEASYPDLAETLFWGAGIGCRYYTPVGPLRLDVAMPLNPDEHMDGNLQFYISLGQAF